MPDFRLVRGPKTHQKHIKMTHRFPIKEIARQAGVGTATVDRVINARAHVSPQTRARVQAALDELEQQEALLAARGRRLFFDFVIEAPTRFSSEVRRAADAMAPQIGTAVCRSRYVVQETMTEGEVVAALVRIRKRGSHGVCIKARSTDYICAAVNDLAAAGIPVVTLVTDLAGTDRVAYVGLDNAGAGKTAAYLLGQSLEGVSGTVLVTRSQDLFLGEEAREDAFRSALRRVCPSLEVVTIVGGGGRGIETSRLIEREVEHLSNLKAVYSVGGGNKAMLAALAHAGLRPKVFVAHDLDAENRRLIKSGDISFVMHHDLRQDLRNVYTAFLRAHGLSSEPVGPLISDIQVITPANIPQEIRA